ncbi:exocyst subunit exo70 family protein B1 [Perilla frutescens var. frutescens]|nr:exocyst subunit exo70 family protein B1 [Perilla frutescens var. frutescens]
MSHPSSTPSATGLPWPPTSAFPPTSTVPRICCSRRCYAWRTSAESFSKAVAGRAATSTTPMRMMVSRARMVVVGYKKECCGIYSSYRREFLERSLSRLGLQKLSIDEVHRMQWTQLEEEIEKWIKAIHVTFRVLFPSERHLCDRVFSGCLSDADFSILEYAGDRLLSF